MREGESPLARGAMALITNASGEVLMHLRDDTAGIAWPGFWALPAGGCEPGEDARTAIARELHEETGLHPDTLTELFQVTDPWGPRRLLTVFHTQYDGAAEDLALTEGVKIQFIPPDHLDTLTVPPFIRDTITRAAPLYQARDPL